MTFQWTLVLREPVTLSEEYRLRRQRERESERERVRKLQVIGGNYIIRSIVF
jgi:hypothetical protein